MSGICITLTIEKETGHSAIATLKGTGASSKRIIGVGSGG